VTSDTFEVNGIQLDRDETRKGQVLYDYEAESDDQLSITTDQVLFMKNVFRYDCVCVLACMFVSHL